MQATNQRRHTLRVIYNQKIGNRSADREAVEKRELLKVER